MRTTGTSSYALAALIAVLAVIVFLPALQNDFVNWDDDKNVYDNTFIRAIDSRFFTTAFFDFPVDYWRPLAWLSHAVDYALWGADPFGHHLTSILLHGLNTLLVVVLMFRLMTARGARDPDSVLPDRAVFIAAGMTGVLFGLHPLHVESVVWISERKDLLCSFFFLLSLTHYVKYAVTAAGEAGRSRLVAPYANRYYLLSLGSFALALSSKPMAVTLPVVLIILDWHPFGRLRNGRSFLTAVLEKLPFFALSALVSILAIYAQRVVGAVRTTEFAPLPTRFLVAAKALIAYLGKMILPLDLVPFYPYPKDASFLSLEYVIPVAFVLGITMTGILLSNRHKLVLSTWGYYIITLLPVLGIIQVGSQSMADRYTYLPSLGPFLVAGIGAALIASKLNMTQRGGRIVAIVSGSLVVCICTVFIVLTIRQTAVWRNSIRLWNYVIEKQPATASVAYYNRAHAFREQGQLDRAIADYDMVLALSPADHKARYERGRLFEEHGQIDRAIADYDEAIALQPSFAEALISRGVLYGRSGDYERAIDCFTRSIAVDPKNVESYNNRGIAHVLSGNYGQALEDFTKAIFLDRTNASVYLNRGRLYLRTGNRALALSDFKRACDLGNAAACAEVPASSP